MLYFDLICVSNLVVLKDALVQVSVSEFSLPLVARVAADQGRTIHEQEVPHCILSLQRWSNIPAHSCFCK